MSDIEYATEEPMAAAPQTQLRIGLRRLLAVASLTPAQAGVLASDLTDELETMRANVRHPSRFDDRSIQVTGSGYLVLAGEDHAGEDHAGGADGHVVTEATGEDVGGGLAGSALPESAAAESAAAESAEWQSIVSNAVALVRALAASARRDGLGSRDNAEALVRGLDGASTDLADLIRYVRAGTTALLGEHQREDRVRQELAALVAATTGRPGNARETTRPSSAEPAARPAPKTIPARAASPRGSRGTAGLQRSGWHRQRVVRPRRLITVALLLALAGALLWWGVPRVAEDVQRGWDTLFATEQPEQQLPPVEHEPATGPETEPATAAGDAGESSDDDREPPEPHPAERAAPASAEPVTEVTIEQVEGACEPGETCAVRVDTHLDQAQQARQVEWSLHAVDRCTGETAELPGMTVSALTGWNQVFGISRAELPESSALALVAVTGEPARAASEPLVVPANGGSC